MDSLYAFVEGITADIAQSDQITLLTIAVALLALLMAVRAGRKAKLTEVESESEELLKSGVQGKIARLERSLNELRTEVLREIALLTNEKPAAAEEEEEELPAVPEEEPSAPSAENLSIRLEKTRSGFLDRIKGLFATKTKLDSETLEELEALLISSDLGVRTTAQLLDDLKKRIEEGAELNQDGLKIALKDGIVRILTENVTEPAEIQAAKADGRPRVVLIVGINGTGKTTSVAKLAHSLKAKGAKVLVVAADTFRAAAVEQLTEWASRIGVPVVSGKPEARPQTVVFDAMQKGVDEDFDVIVVDTAGRLHTKSNLMQELEGIGNIIKRFNSTGADETLLVLDGAAGQNALQQAKEFHEAVPLSGVVVTKLDGTPKGGIVVAVKDEIGIPVRYIGVGEGQDDLRPFDAEAFARAILGEEKEPKKVTSSHARKRRRRKAAGE